MAKTRRAKPDIRERFGTAVKFRREGLGLTQEDLADAAGIHRTYLSDIERGTRNPSLVNIERLAAALGMALSDLFAAGGRAVTARAAAGGRLTQAELGERCGRHRTFVGSVERGERNLALLSLQKMARALRTPPAALVGDGA